MNKILPSVVVIVVVLIAFYFLAPGTIFAPTIETPDTAATSTAETYTSRELGIQFQYEPKLDENFSVNVKEVGRKVYLYISNAAPEDGQSVEVFAKNADETLEASIRRQILAEYPSPLCKIDVTPSNIQGGYQVAEISYPRPSNDEEAWFANYELCNPRYDKTNGIRYFLYDPKHPGTFAFLNIGQYAIMGHDEIPWQYTLTFI